MRPRSDSLPLVRGEENVHADATVEIIARSFRLVDTELSLHDQFANNTEPNEITTGRRAGSNYRL